MIFGTQCIPQYNQCTGQLTYGWSRWVS